MLHVLLGESLPAAKVTNGFTVVTFGLKESVALRNEGIHGARSVMRRVPELVDCARANRIGRRSWSSLDCSAISVNPRSSYTATSILWVLICQTSATFEVLPWHNEPMAGVFGISNAKKCEFERLFPKPTRSMHLCTALNRKGKWE